MALSEEELRRLANVRTRAVREEHADGPFLKAQSDLYLYDDPHMVSAMVERVRRTTTPWGVEVLYERAVPITGADYRVIHGIPFEIQRMRSGRTYHVPPVVKERAALIQAQFKVTWQLWGDELVDESAHIPLESLESYEAVTEIRRAMWERQRERTLERALRALERERELVRHHVRPPDPILIHVIRTGAERGLWLNVGMWADEQRH